jgi:hypothetical protein
MIESDNETSVKGTLKQLVREIFFDYCGWYNHGSSLLSLWFDYFFFRGLIQYICNVRLTRFPRIFYRVKGIS